MIGYAIEGARMEFIKVWVYHDWLHYWRGMYEIYKSTEFAMIGYAIEGACMEFIKVWVCLDWLHCWRGTYQIYKSMSLSWLVTLLKGHIWNL